MPWASRKYGLLIEEIHETTAQIICCLLREERERRQRVHSNLKKSLPPSERLNGKRREKEGKNKELFIYNVCDHKDCYNEVEAQAISYTAGVPPVVAAMLIANGTWDVKTMVNVEELDPDPFIELLAENGLTTEIITNIPSKKFI